MKKKQSNLHKSNGKKRGPVGIDRPEKILVENEAKNSCEIPSKKLKINDERTSKSETEEVVFSTKIMKRQRELLDEGKLDNSGNKSKKIIEQKNKSKTVSKNYPFDADAKRKLEELKKQCKLDGLSSKNISLIVKKWKRREKRRLARVEERKKDKVKAYEIFCSSVSIFRTFSVFVPRPVFIAGSTVTLQTIAQKQTKTKVFQLAFVSNVAPPNIE